MEIKLISIYCMLFTRSWEGKQICDSGREGKGSVGARFKERHWIDYNWVTEESSQLYSGYNFIWPNTHILELKWRDLATIPLLFSYQLWHNVSPFSSILLLVVVVGKGCNSDTQFSFNVFVLLHFGSVVFKNLYWRWIVWNGLATYWL